MTRSFMRLVGTTSTALLVIVAAAAVPSGTAAAAAPKTLFVSTTGNDASNNCQASGTPCKTLGHAIASASFGDTIQLEPGTYKESDNPSVAHNGKNNVIDPSRHGLTIQSHSGPGTAANTIIDATDMPHGLLIEADSVTVKNIGIHNADQQAIFFTPPAGSQATTVLSHETVTGNIITNNDACSKHPTRPVCPSPDVNDDYGEAIQLLSVVHSTVANNTVTNNVGGILLTDEFGPNHDNTISHNTVSNNKKDCGITLAGHNANAVSSNGPTGLAGVFHNTVTGNTANGNGAAGIIMATGPPGGGVYGNTVTGNTASGNGLGGITIHSHSPMQWLNNNVITGNTLSHNGLSGNENTGGPGDSDAGVTKTHNILVLAAVGVVNGTIITGNTLSNTDIGVWLSPLTPRALVTGNTITTATKNGARIVVGGPSHGVVGIAPTLSGRGYWMTDANGVVFPFGDADYFGSMFGIALHAPIVGITAAPDGKGYALAASDGGIFNFGSAKFFGSLGNIHLVKPIVAVTGTQTGNGYYLGASDGGVFALGDAKFKGSLGNIHLAQPIVGMTRTPTGHGYLLTASDGGVFAFGNAVFKGSLGNIHLAQPIVGITNTPAGAGYLLVASDGGVFAFGNAVFKGSLGNIHLAQPISGIARTPSGNGYLLSAADGGVFAFGDAVFAGSVPGNM